MKSKNIFLKGKLVGFFGIIFVMVSSTIIPLSVHRQEKSNLTNQTFNSDEFSISNSNPDGSFFANSVKPLVPIEFNTYMPLISTKQGPIGFFKDEIRALDWFGSLRWVLDTTSWVADGHTTYVDRNFVNWAYSFNNDVLWVLTNAAENQNQYQRIVSIDGKNGKVIKEINLPNKLTSRFQLYYFIQILNSGDVLIYGQGSSFTPNSVFYSYDPTKDIMSTIGHGISTSFLGTALPTNGGEVRLFNIIPITNNRNIMVFQRFNSKDVSFALVDENFNLVYSNTNNSIPWSSMVPLASKTNSIVRWQPFPDKTFYKLLDGRIVTIIFNQLLIFDNIKIENTQSFIVQMNLPNPVQSFSFDTNENMFLTYRNDSSIHKLTLPIRNSTQQVISFPYYNLLDSSVSGIRDNSSKFVLYNVNGYAGQIMLIKPIERLEPGISAPFNPTQAEIETNKYGLAAAIVNNINVPTNGDSKGLLNTAAAFQFSADFDIDSSILGKKLPSEIIVTDLNLQNDSTFTINKSLNEQGLLLYPTFSKLNINDENGTLTIEVNLDQIPWFTDRLPDNFIPLKITKVFNTIDKISSRISWKNANTNYNFLNTLPSKIDSSDLEMFDPFLIDLSSQRIINDSTQTLIYPRKEYTVTSANDQTGIVSIQCVYTYMPLGVSTESLNARTYTASQNFNIFKSTDTKRFDWLLLGSVIDNNDIKQIPSLKILSESNILPSSINDSDKNQFLLFVNTITSVGYPPSKMNFTLVANDQLGELRITAVLPASYTGTQDETFVQTYIGFNKISDYSFAYKKPSYLNQISGSGTAINNPTPTYEYNKMRPTEVTEWMIYSDFVNYSGYNSLDFEISFRPNNILGELEVIFVLNGKYPLILANNINTFQLENGKYVSKITLSGFLTNEEYEKQYSLVFKDDNDSTINSIKNIEINIILDSIASPEGLVIDGIKYTSLEQLVELFISFKGFKIPTIKASNVSVYLNNSSGILTFELIFLPSETGYDTNLIFSSIFTGFIQGVDKPTSDSFVFKNQNNLDSTLLLKLPSLVKAELIANRLLVKNYFINLLFGQFNSLILNQNAFQLYIDANDVYGSLSITIVFDKTLITNPQTLNTYSIAYTGFQKIS